MTLRSFVGAGSMAMAHRLRRTKAAGVIINGHTLTASQTRLQVDVLSRWFDFIHHDELQDRLARPRSRPFCLLTFDDGKRSGFTETAPELERLGIPAVFYVVTRFLTDGTPLWFDRCEAIRRSVGYTPPGLESVTLKELPIAVIHERLDRACSKYEVDPHIDSEETRPMSWGEARELARRGFTIGSHSLSHAVLTRETQAMALADIERSIAEVSAGVGTKCLTFAFPNGNYTARLARYAVECGVQTAMTTEPHWVDSSVPLWRLPRVQLFGSNTPSKIELKVALAATCLLLRDPNGTGRLYRKINRLMRSSPERVTSAG
jgi:peptidoglycan/xylan/chitin deacetylase (PgdA/CDA1 family)